MASTLARFTFVFLLTLLVLAHADQEEFAAFFRSRRSPFVFSPIPDFPPPPQSPNAAGISNLWCVARASAPAEKLQEAMDYACGDGEADCSEIQIGGRCFFPDDVAAHASYAFNSYWQKWKRDGGTCDFEGAAVFVTSDPSYSQCHFIAS